MGMRPDASLCRAVKRGVTGRVSNVCTYARYGTLHSSIGSPVVYQSRSRLRAGYGARSRKMVAGPGDRLGMFRSCVLLLRCFAALKHWTAGRQGSRPFSGASISVFQATCPTVTSPIPIAIAAQKERIISLSVLDVCRGRCVGSPDGGR